MINFVNLEYFLVVAEQLNFTKAAKKLFISQQSLSSYIARLENNFGVELFNHTVPLTLTPAGKSITRHMEPLLLAIKKIVICHKQQRNLLILRRKNIIILLKYI